MLAPLQHIDSSTMGAIFSICVAVTGLVAGLLARRRDSSISLAIWVSIGFGSLAVLTTGLFQAICAIIGASYAVLYRRWTEKAHEVPSETTQPSSQAFAILGVIAVTWVLLYRLSADLLPPLVWEATVTLNFIKELEHLDIAKALLKRLIWAQGLLSEGDRSLLYGFPTLCLLSLKSSLVSVRIFSVAYFVGATLCLALLCKRVLSPTIATVVIFTFGLNELGLIFGRYGSSVAATLFALTLALWACASLVNRPSLRGALLALLCLYLATLGYAPGRLVVLILIGMTFVGVLCNTSTRIQSRVSIALVLSAGIVMVCAAQHQAEHLRAYAFARGEQLSTMMRTGYLPHPLLSQWAVFQAEEREPTTLDYLTFGKELLTLVTIPELRDLLSPFDQAKPHSRKFSFDPLRLELYAKPLYPFILLGLLMVPRYTSRWTHTTLLLWAVLGCAPVLLTNRVDSYRTSMLLIPLSIWMAVGMREALNEARRVRVPRSLTSCVLLATILTIVASRSASLHFRSVTPSATDLTINSIPPRLLHNATLGVEAIGFQSLALTKIHLLERQQKGIAVPARIMLDKSYESLVATIPSEEKANTLNELIDDLTNDRPLILGPSRSMIPTLKELSRRGFLVQPIRVGQVSLAYVVKR